MNAREEGIATAGSKREREGGHSSYLQRVERKEWREETGKWRQLRERTERATGGREKRKEEMGR